ncbi:MAG: dihydrolipoyl dehydrogenase [Chloroflexota bacterium]|nr:dihydrolipoyl dehydrogenase [Chloroflexota bacterium]
MKKYDVIVIGSGCGMICVEEALGHGLSVALVDRGPLGGTCLNVGCIPSKMLIFPADRIVEIEEAQRLGIGAQVTHVDFGAIMERMRRSVAQTQGHIEEAITSTDEFDFYRGEGHFVADYTLEVAGERIRGKRIFIASGSRPLIPPIKGLDTVDYLTNETVLALTERPQSLIIIGGGYIAVEYGHFFAAMGTRVTILEMAERLVLSEEPEVAELLKQELSRRMEVHTGALVEEARRGAGGCTVWAKDAKSGERREFAAERVMVAVGRRSNADLLQVEAGGIETDGRGFVKTNEYLETSKENVYAVGDANGKAMFTHTANREASLAVHGALRGERVAMDYATVPHAVYSSPQVASVGLTEEAARKGHEVLVGRARYFDVAKGEAMMEERGFAKAIAEKESGRILGFHVIGPYAPILIQEVVNAMTSGGHIGEVAQGIHIHPALTELITATLGNLEEG